MRLLQLRDSFDLLVIGGGINGAGIAREAARRGWRVALVERHDYAAGTTGRATRLIHGGLRYLEQFELGLVFESLREREWLLRNKPHLVRPLQFIIPVHQGSARSALTMRAGMLLYDLLSARKSLPSHRTVRAAELRDLAREMNMPGVKGAFLYYDGQVNFPERLTVETILDAQRHGAVAANHCELVRFRMDGERRVRGAVVRDSLSGEEAELETSFTVNASGPWLEQLDSLLRGRTRRLLAPTRGSHIVVARFPGAPHGALYFEARSDRRPMFVIPWQGLCLIGTTDVPFSGDPDGVRPAAEEVNYLLAETNALLPAAGLSRASILFSYAGIRALPYAESARPAELTRRHILFDHEKEDGIAGIVTILGGKLTTYRSLARQVVNLIARKLHRIACGGKPAEELPQLMHWPWDGSRDELEKVAAPDAQRFGFEPSAFVRLFELYGEGATRILDLLVDNPRLREPLAPESPVLAAEVVYAVHYEQAHTLGDVMLRRTCAALSPGRGAAEAAPVAELLAQEFGWNPAQHDAALCGWDDEVSRALPLLA